MVLAACASRPAAGDGLGPDPTHSPRTVVALQLEAFGTGTREGIAEGFSFASPGNQNATGPLDRFISLLESPGYELMLNYDRVEWGPTAVRGTVAVQRVALFRGDELAVYDFVLVRQAEGDCTNCWMTDAVQLIDRRVPEPPPII